MMVSADVYAALKTQHMWPSLRLPSTSVLSDSISALPDHECISCDWIYRGGFQLMYISVEIKKFNLTINVTIQAEYHFNQAVVFSMILIDLLYASACVFIQLYKKIVFFLRTTMI